MAAELQGTTTGNGQRNSLIAFSTELIDAANSEGLGLRALGGVAVALRCPSANPPRPLARGFSDVDMVTTRRSVRKLGKLLQALGCSPNERFNASNGDTRLLFYFGEDQHMDVFVDCFRLCHELPLGDRLGHHRVTVTLADLLLSKLQVAKLSHKDVTDAAALLLDHPLSPDENGINVDYLAGVLASDWGWWRTCTETLERLRDLFRPLGVSDEDQRLLEQRLATLSARIEERPKSLRWKTRARIGDRRSWRVDPDDLAP